MLARNKPNALFIDDGKNVLLQLKKILEEYGFRVFTATNGKQLIDKSIKHLPQLIILDTFMDGIETCIELRSHKTMEHVPIIFYTSLDDDITQIAALNAGADDYIIKPVKPSILLRRIAAHMKRAIAVEKPMPSGLLVDRDRYLVFNNGKKFLLPRKEFELLWLLYSFPQKVFTRQEIAASVWGCEDIFEGRTIEVHIRRVRKKLGYNCVRTIRGVGYSINIKKILHSITSIKAENILK